jgi:isocitrate lyase
MNTNGNGSKNGQRSDAAEIHLAQQWASAPRWAGIVRPYSAADVGRLRGTISIEYTLASIGAQRLWELLQVKPTSRRWARLPAIRRFSRFARVCSRST